MKNGEYTGLTDGGWSTVYDQSTDAGAISRGLNFEAVGGDIHVRLTPHHTTDQAETYQASPARGCIVVPSGAVRAFYAGNKSITKIEARAAAGMTGSLIVSSYSN